MNKIKKTLPFILAALLIVLCYFGIELSQILLPNYKNTLWKIEESEKISLLYFDNTTNLELYPMNLYDRKTVKKATSKSKYKYTNELVTGLIKSFYPKVHFLKDIDFRDYLEISVSEPNIYYIRDVKFTATNKRNYTINVAFTEKDVLYFSCIPECDERISTEQIENAYKNLENDLKMYVVSEVDYFQRQEREVVSDNLITSKFGDTGFNSFVSFINNLEVVDNVCKKFDINLNCTTINEIITDSTSSGISYNEMMYVTFTNASYQLIMIYDLNDSGFVGFSLFEKN